MEKLKPEHIACFLPYGLKLYNDWHHSKHGLEYRPTTLRSLGTDNLFWVSGRVDSEHLKYTQYKPILREFDLTKPIIHNGVEVIPIVELANICKPDYTWSIKENGIYAENIGHYRFGWNEQIKSFWLMFKYDYAKVSNQLQLFKKLYEWKFDIDNLIGRGLAVSASSLNINPYDK